MLEDDHLDKNLPRPHSFPTVASWELIVSINFLKSSLSLKLLEKAPHLNKRDSSEGYIELFTERVATQADMQGI